MRDDIIFGKIVEMTPDGEMTIETEDDELKQAKVVPLGGVLAEDERIYLAAIEHPGDGDESRDSS